MSAWSLEVNKVVAQYQNLHLQPRQMNCRLGRARFPTKSQRLFSSSHSITIQSISKLCGWSIHSQDMHVIRPVYISWLWPSSTPNNVWDYLSGFLYPRCEGWIPQRYKAIIAWPSQRYHVAHKPSQCHSCTVIDDVWSGKPNLFTLVKI